MRKSKKLLQPPLCRILDDPLQPPLNFAEFGAPAVGYWDGRVLVANLLAHWSDSLVTYLDGRVAVTT